METPTLDLVATTGGRFSSALDAEDPATLKAAVFSGVYQACKEQLSDEVQRLQPLVASGSDDELAAARCVTSLALAEAAAAVAEADAALRLRGLADDPDFTPHWPDRLNDSLHRVNLILAAMQRYPPERRRMQGQLLLTGLRAVGAYPPTGSSWAARRRFRPQASSMA